MLKLDYMDVAGDRLSELRLLVEGAITLFEDEAAPLCHLAAKADAPEAHQAFNDIGAALYCMRRHIIHLQSAHYKEATKEPSDA